jgi:hypothetical protein
MAEPVGHFGSMDLQKVHDDSIQTNTTEGGACLTGHEEDFEKKKKKNTCNYRYQSYEQALAEQSIRNRLHSYERKIPKEHHEDGQLLLFITTSVYERKSGGLWPACLSAYLPLPGPGDWHVGGPLRPISRGRIDKKTDVIPIGQNFTNMRWPYWNNAHHLISKGTFRSTILAVKEAGIPQMIQSSLMKAKYNINHKLNMLLIPQDKEVANILGLPRHLQQKEGDATVSPQVTDHPRYTDLVKSKLEKIIEDYASICLKAQKEKEKKHDTPDPDLDKKRLESLSKSLLKMVLNWGGTDQPGDKGCSLDAAAAA